MHPQAHRQLTSDVGDDERTMTGLGAPTSSVERSRAEVRMREVGGNRKTGMASTIECQARREQMGCGSNTLAASVPESVCLCLPTIRTSTPKPDEMASQPQSARTAGPHVPIREAICLS